MNQITVEVTKTVQVQQYEPVTVRVTETMVLDKGTDTEEARKSLYKRVTRAVASYVENEQAKWETKAKERKRK